MTEAERVAAPARSSLMRPLLFSVFARALPLTMLGPLLPGIAASLGATLAQVGWIVATYATGSLIAQPIMGRLADDIGRKRILFACLALFGAGSLASALATSLPLLIAGRIVQALGAGGIQPVATAIIANRLQPQRQGGAIGALYGAFGIGTMAGALCGGGLVAAAIAIAPRTTGWIAGDLRDFPWHLVFWLNVLLALAAAGLARSLPNDRSRADLKPRGYDPLGVALIVGIAAALMVTATNPNGIAAWGVVATVGLVALFVVQERRSHAPVIDPELFASRGPALLYWIALGFGVPSFTLTIYSATFLIMRFHASPEQAGVGLFVLATAYVASAIAGGALISRISFRTLLVCAATVVALGIVSLAFSTSMLIAIVAMSLGGVGLGLASAPPNALLLRYVKREHSGSATGVASMLATSGAITAPALIGTFLARWTSGDPVDAMRAALEVCAALAILCAAIAATLPQPDAVEEYCSRASNACPSGP
jgi:MFS family permease